VAQNSSVWGDKNKKRKQIYEPMNESWVCWILNLSAKLLLILAIPLVSYTPTLGTVHVSRPLPTPEGLGMRLCAAIWSILNVDSTFLPNVSSQEVFHWVCKSGHWGPHPILLESNTQADAWLPWAPAWELLWRVQRYDRTVNQLLTNIMLHIAAHSLVPRPSGVGRGLGTCTVPSVAYEWYS
jgi:hypothetical protein